MEVALEIGLAVRAVSVGFDGHGDLQLSEPVDERDALESDFRFG
jgi:hypothetical protein